MRIARIRSAWISIGCGAALALAVLAGPVHGASARELLDRVKALNESTRKWTDRTQKLRLRIVDRRGGERARDLKIYMKKFPEEASRSIVFFESPPEIKGTGFLQWVNPHTEDQQWLYLPELKRVRQISAGSKRESFVGTDFSYEDLAIMSQITDWTEADAGATVVAEEPADGQTAAVIEFVPAAKDVGYGRIRAWLGLEQLVILRCEFVDQSGTLVKRLTVRDIRNVGPIPTAFRYTMENLRSGSRTEVEFQEIVYDTGLQDDAFTKRALEREGI